VKSIEERLQAVEDRLEIYNVVSAWGPAADGCNLNAMGRIFSEDAIWDNRDYRYIEGLANIRDLLNSADHRTLTDNGAAHVGNLPHVELDGDRAIATNYSVVVGRREDQPAVVRVTVSRIYLSRGFDGWRINRRIIDPLDGRASSRELAARLFEGPALDPGEKSDRYSLPQGQTGAWQGKLEALYQK
jgi:ketosteroid isomerase-like protein